MLYLTYICTMSNNTNFNAVLFTGNSTNPKAPALSGFVSIPVSQIEQVMALLQEARRFSDQGVDTVRLPLSFWSAEGKAPLAFKGQSSFYTPNTSAPAVDPTPAVA